MSLDPPVPPAASLRPVWWQRHGDQEEDPFAWLKDDNWREVMRDPACLAPDIRAHLEAENEYTRLILADTAALQAELFAELKGRIEPDDESVPVPDGEFAYYRRYEDGGQHPIFCRRGRRGDDGAEEILLHGDEEARGHEFFRVSQLEHSPGHRYIAYSVDVNGSEIYTIRIKDLSSQRLLDETLPDACGDLAWARDEGSILYTVLNEEHRPSQVRRHRIGSPSDADELVYEESDPGFFVGVSTTENRRFAVIDAHDHTTSEVRLLDTDDPRAKPQVVATRETDVEYRVSHHGDRLIILTNADDAEDFKLVEISLETWARDRGRAGWRDLVGHRPGTLILDVAVFANHIVRLEREQGLARIVVLRIASGEEHVIAFDEAAYSLGLRPGYEFDTPILRYTYSSPTTPERTYDYHMDRRERELRKEQEVPSGHDPARYVTTRLQAPSPDGERVPVTLLHHQDTPLDGSAPVLLYGYGSYGYAVPAAFSTTRLSLVDRGFIYAIAHVRGGTECGYRWYRTGKRQHKPNTFYDFIGAAEHLIDTGVASAGEIACHGGSAGGMLVGAVINLRPELFRAAVGEVPFVDVLNTMCDESLPLTPPEWPEWGNPITEEADYRMIRSYSPYDNVTTQAYPHVLATAGLTDPRVAYWEPAKWVAQLRAQRTNDNLVLLKTNLSAGHAGAAGRFDRLEETALVYAFLLKAFDRR